MRRTITVLWISLCALVVSSAAHARTETIRWTQDQLSIIAGFEIRWGTETGSHTNVVDVGLPTPDASGVFSATVNLPDGPVYMVARSYDLAGYFSDFSAEKFLRAPTTELDLPPGGSWTADFASSSTGTVVPGWIDTGPNDSLVEDDSLFELMDVGGNRVMGTRSELLNIHSHLLGASSWTNYEFNGRIRIEDPSGSAGVTVYSAYPDADAYYKLFRIGTNADAAFWIVGVPAIVCDTENTGVTPAPGVWYRFRFEVSSSSTANRLRARVWRDGDSEPTVWQATCLDQSPTRLTSGTVGVWSRGPGAKYWDSFEAVSVPPLAEDASGGGSTSTLGVPGQPFLVNP